MTSTYLQTNTNLSNPIVYSLTTRGFYSEINNLLNAILFGLVTKRRLYVDETRFADGHLAWSDLYSSCLPLVSGDIHAEIDDQWMIESVKSAGFRTISDSITKWHRQRRFFFSRSYGFYESVFAAKRQLARQFCQPVEHLKCSRSWPLYYAAMHVRRGDKIEGYPTSQGKLIIEGDDVRLDEYLSIIRRKTPHLQSLFVMTDDYRVIEELRCIDSRLDIYSFCQEEEHGYKQGEFNSLGAQSKSSAVRRLISEVEIASHSSIFVGCYKSNVSRYIALIHDNPRRCYSIDGQKQWHPG